MADTATQIKPTANSTGDKPKRVQKSRVPDGHTLIKMHIPDAEVQHLALLANENDRQTPDDMARSILRQHVRNDLKNRSAARSTS